MHKCDMHKKNLFKNINIGLYISLIFLGLLPAIYMAVRTNLLGQLPGDYSYSIAGQLSWVNLLYEVVNEAVILPLFCFLAVKDRKEFENRLRTGLLTSAAIYTIFAVVISLSALPLLKFMAASKDILAESAVYIRIESIALIFGIMYDFAIVALITIGRQKNIYAIAVIKCALTIIFDIFFVSSLPLSLHMGVNGVGFSNILANALMFAAVIYMLEREGYHLFAKERMSFSWLRDFSKTGGISGLESFVRNIAYMLMVSRMVNIVGEQGTYWVANNFIWGWLLLPVLQLGELIKREVAEDNENIKRNTKGYFVITAAICLVWVAAIPFYKPFMSNVLGFADTDKLFSLVMLLLVPYMFFAFQNIFDATFYGTGRTEYMLFESVVTNTVYYGAFFIAFLCGAWTPTLTGIAVMFGLGNIFDSIVSGIAYAHFRRLLNQTAGTS